MGIKAESDRIRAKALELYGDERELTLDVLNMAGNNDTKFYIIYGNIEEETRLYFNQIEYYGEIFKGTPGSAEGYTGEIYKLYCMGWIYLDCQGVIGGIDGNKYEISLTTSGDAARKELMAKHERDAQRDAVVNAAVY